jgi:uncharacterized protein (TIGR00297 family)
VFAPSPEHGEPRQFTQKTGAAGSYGSRRTTAAFDRIRSLGLGLLWLRDIRSRTGATAGCSSMSLISGILLATRSAGPGPRIAVALLVTVGLAVLARGIRAVTTGGAVAGALLTFTMFVAAGPGTFAGVAAVFLLAWGSTSWGRTRKRQVGTRDASGRRAIQIVANLGAATAAAILWAATSRPGFLPAVASALAEAAGDTVSSECGQALSPRARLVTTGECVAAGVDGAVSFPGTVAGIAGAAGVALVCAAAGVISDRQIGWAVAAAVAGIFADSYLGAVLQRRGLLSNDSVNFISTMLAGALAFLGAHWAAS